MQELAVQAASVVGQDIEIDCENVDFDTAAAS